MVGLSAVERVLFAAPNGTNNVTPNPFGVPQMVAVVVMSARGLYSTSGMWVYPNGR